MIDLQEISVKKLLGQDALVQAVASIEKHGDSGGAVLGHVDAADVPDFEIIGHGANRPFFGFENIETDLRPMRQERSTPTPGPEGTKRRHRQEGSIDG